MKTELILWTGVALMVAVVISSLAVAEERETDWADRSPLAFGEPMEDCDQHHPALVAKEEVLPTVIPAVAPVQDVEPVKPATGKTTQKPLSPNSLSPGALFTFALIASPGSQLPVNAK